MYLLFLIIGVIAVNAILVTIGIFVIGKPRVVSIIIQIVLLCTFFTLNYKTITLDINVLSSPGLFETIQNLIIVIWFYLWFLTLAVNSLSELGTNKTLVIFSILLAFIGGLISILTSTLIGFIVVFGSVILGAIPNLTSSNSNEPSY